MITKEKITHVIFDYDGIIQDSEMAYSIANAEVLKLYGREFNNILKAGMMGKRRDEAVEWIIHQTGLSDTLTPEKYNEVYEVKLEELLAAAPILPGIEKIIDYFEKMNIPLAICTGSDTHEFSLKTKNVGHLLKSFPIIVLAGDDPEVKFGKPAPDPYLITMKRFKNPPKQPSNVLVFEDSINGVRSALASGCTTCYIPQECFKPHDWEKRIVDIKPLVSEILGSMEEFDPTRYGLPSF